VRRLYSLRTGEAQNITLRVADRILTALDRPDALHELPIPDFVPIAPSLCEDCGGEIEAGVLPVDLFREDPTSLQDRVWDSTKQRWVRRPGHARAGGKRFRLWHLCRRCRAEVLRDRAHNANGRLRTKDRKVPKRGGRPRLLNEEELRAAHRIY